MNLVSIFVVHITGAPRKQQTIFERDKNSGNKYLQLQPVHWHDIKKQLIIAIVAFIDN